MNTKMPESGEKNRGVSVSALLSLLGFSVTLAIIVLELSGNLVSAGPKIVPDFIALSLFVLTFFVPFREWIFAGVCMGLGLVNIFYGGDLLGLLFYSCALAMGLKLNWFRHNARIKTPLFIVLFVAALLTQLRYGLSRFIIAAVNIGIGCALIVAFVILFNDILKDFYHEKPVLDLSKYDLSSRQIACIEGVRKRRSTGQIVAQLAVSPSVIKKELVALYATFTVSDYVDFQLFLAAHCIVLPETVRSGRSGTIQS